jgi:hypothetical protein
MLHRHGKFLQEYHKALSGHSKIILRGSPDVIGHDKCLQIHANMYWGLLTSLVSMSLEYVNMFWSMLTYLGSRLTCLGPYCHVITLV